MKEVILSADGDSYVYLVPDVVAENLREYCIEFDNWLSDSPDAKKYRTGRVICHDQEDFIDYLNQYIFPDQQSAFVKNLGETSEGQNLPKKYKSHPYFNF